ncbi:hypothetical protein KC19_9G190100 [Ceratodon purpureus]|uniref:Uncharacterized protein n=1 Tax=Ceratodon purpureus TaxID=3225 RepID=A0A8T0GX65_CERPU|nr:hypothetical protein KC19_9G190100 [Ceratodon purpureus]
MKLLVSLFGCWWFPFLRVSMSGFLRKGFLVFGCVYVVCPCAHRVFRLLIGFQGLVVGDDWLGESCVVLRLVCIACTDIVSRVLQRLAACNQMSVELSVSSRWITLANSKLLV